MLCLALAMVASPLANNQAGAACPAGYVAPPQLVPGIDYCVPNYANSPVLTKFVDSLPGLTQHGLAVAGFWPAGANNRGQSIPVAIADTTSYPGPLPPASDYYEIALVEYSEQLHADMPATKLRGYVQVETPANTAVSKHVPLPGGLFGVDNPSYLGPVIVASKGTATRIKFYNLLPTMATGGDLFIPTDVTVMGAGMGPDGTMYPQNRATLHLHGGDNPWISDGTTHQWITPAGESGTLIKGVSQQNVPDMPKPPAGSATFYFTNGQSGRLMFYHEHAYGITRLGVYAGMAAGYLLTDPTERALNSFAPGGEVPLIIQDKAFVSDGSVPAPFPVDAVAPAITADSDPTWASNPAWGQTKGSLWFPHVYMPNQNPNDLSGANPMGRWDYGPWFWPVFPVTGTLPQTTTGPLPTIVPEAFVDTPIVNGTAYPNLSVNPTTYRFRVLNACNDRYLNLQLYEASPIIGSVTVSPAGSGYTSAPLVAITPAIGDPGHGATAHAIIDPATGAVTSIEMDTVGSGYVVAPTVTLSAPPAGGTQASATANIYTSLNPLGKLTEVGMIPAVKNSGVAWPSWWTANDTPGMIPNVLDDRQGGVPDPATIGPSFIHIGSEGGISPQAYELQNTPIGYEQNKRSVTVLNTYEHTLFLGPAERADVMVDFSQFAGKTLIMYNDAPAPLPAGDPRNDYYTADPDNTFQGGAPSTLPGFGPNTRTIMQINVSGTATPTAPLNVAALSAAVSSAFGSTQAKPVVPETTYTAALGAPPSGTDTYSTISATSLSFSPYVGAPEYTGSALTSPLQPKTIQELFDPLGRMNATLGVEVPFTTATVQTTIPYGFADPATEVIPDGTTQLWKITHNGVDTHAIHFHLFNVQVVNRVGWDGAIKPPWPEELGWKETVKMNPLEDIIVALRAKTPTVPFGQPNNMRPLDPTMPSTYAFTGVVDPNNNPVANFQNSIVNFGNEYTWHCHLLGHEENDMMRPIMVATAPKSPNTPIVTISKGQAVITWQDLSPDETAYIVQKLVSGSTTWTTLATVPAGVLTYTDTTWKAKQGATYRVIAVNTVGSGVAGFPSATAYSPPSGTVQASAPLGVTNIYSVTQALAVGSPIVVNWTYSATDQTGFQIQMATSNTFPANSTITSINYTTAAVSGFTATLKVPALKKNTTYYFRVIPTNLYGSGTPSNVPSLLVHP